MKDTERKDSDEARRFMRSLQALAAPANDQLRLFPEFAEVADELALEHEETQAVYLNSSRPFLSSTQRSALATLDKFIEDMSGPEKGQFWTLEALDSAPEWKRVRELAATALRAMGWPLELPPQHRAIYIGRHSS